MRAKTVFFNTSKEVIERLSALGLSREKLISAGAAAYGSRMSASALHPANARGTFAYHDGVEALRVEFVGRDGWRSYAVGGLEGIFNEELKVIVLFKNVDSCCNEIRLPQARRIGVNSERLCSATLFDAYGIELPDDSYTLLPTSTNVKTRHVSVFYLMLDPEGGLELSCPVIEREAIVHCIERIFLVEGGVLDAEETLPDEGPINGDDFEIEVKRKNEQ